MLTNIDVGKLSELLIKYKVQITALGCLFLLVLSFQLGRSSVDLPLPPVKEDFCSEYIDLNKILKKQVEDEKLSCKSRIDSAIDRERTSCDERVNETLQEHVRRNAIRNCRNARQLVKQCKGR
tara:strand:- start:382 stop:750 length:369 start_codon:yes stop_codon:yes gene_type:complete